MPLNLRYSLLIGIILTLFNSVLLPEMRLLWLAPAVVISWYRRNHTQALMVSAACGLLSDLLASNAHFGIHALTYTLATLFLYDRRGNFFDDHWSTIPILTALFAVCTTVMLSVFTATWRLSPAWIASDLIIMPCLDGLYCLALINIAAWMKRFGTTAREEN